MGDKGIRELLFRKWSPLAIKNLILAPSVKKLMTNNFFPSITSFIVISEDIVPTSDISKNGVFPRK